MWIVIRRGERNGILCAYVKGIRLIAVRSTSIPQSIGEVDGKYSLNSGAIDSSIGAQWKNGRKIFVAPSKSQVSCDT